MSKEQSPRPNTGTAIGPTHDPVTIKQGNILPTFQAPPPPSAPKTNK